MYTNSDITRTRPNIETHRHSGTNLLNTALTVAHTNVNMDTYIDADTHINIDTYIDADVHTNIDTYIDADAHA